MKWSCLKYGRMAVALMVAVLCVLAFGGKFYGVKIFDVQVVPLLQSAIVNPAALILGLLAALVGITLLFGRIYCSLLCPLGLMQELMMLVFEPLKKLFKIKISLNHKHYNFGYFLALVGFGGLIGGTVVVLRHIDPYSIAGNALSGGMYGLILVAVLAALVFWKKRFFCANICPVGAVLGLLSRFSLLKIRIDENKCLMCSRCAQKCPTGSIDFKNKQVNNETCIKCFNCLGGCQRGALFYGPAAKRPKAEFNEQRREFLLKSGSLVVLLLAFRSGLGYTSQVVKKIKAVLLPAGAGKAEDFANRCLNCNLCVKNCPMKIIKPADKDFPVVHLDYNDSFCDYNCHRCSQVCPSGAIKPITLAEKQRTKLGTAMVMEEVCVKCGLCVETCPREIIRKEEMGFPQISADECIGCGACQTVCPVKAIKVVPVDEQLMI